MFFLIWEIHSHLIWFYPKPWLLIYFSKPRPNSFSLFLEWGLKLHNYNNFCPPILYQSAVGKDFLFKSALGHCVEFVELNPLMKICIFAFLLSANIHCITMHCSNAPYSLHLSNFICILDSSSDLIFREALSNKIRCESSILFFLKNGFRRTPFLVYFTLDFYCLCSLQNSSSK